MSDVHEMERAFYETHTFKGKQLEPFTQGRKDVLLSVGVNFAGGKITIMDMHIIMFTLVTDRKTLATAHRDPEAYAEKVLAWVDENITEEDYEEEGRVIKAVLEASGKTKATAIEDPAAVGGEMGNALGQ